MLVKTISIDEAKDLKLKDVLMNYIDESYNDIKALARYEQLDVLEVITKYNNMLINIKTICQTRNKF